MGMLTSAFWVGEATDLDEIDEGECDTADDNTAPPVLLIGSRTLG
jgi:hypothetical protein